VPVVDHGGGLLGLLARGAATLGLMTSGGARTVFEHMVVDVPAVDENDSLGRALRLLAARHARELTVTSATGEVVGMLRDVDAMHIVAHVSRTGTRPSWREAPGHFEPRPGLCYPGV
jgi:predicted transcriptional regulator